MRKTRQDQLPSTPTDIDHLHAKEANAISGVLDAIPMIAEQASQDLLSDGANPRLGAPGLTGEFAVRAALLKQVMGFS